MPPIDALESCAVELPQSVHTGDAIPGNASEGRGEVGMSYTLTISQEADHLYIKATGNRTRESVIGLARECVAACKQHQRTQFLLDLQEMPGQLSSVDAYEFLHKTVHPLGLGLGLRGAILDLQSNTHRLAFFETVAFNTGINLRVFTSPSKALDWLLGATVSESG